MTSTFSYSKWVWPGAILFLGAASGLLYLLGVSSHLRVSLTVGFLLVCPGMAFVRLVRLDKPYHEWTLAIALSISLDGLIAIILLYGGLWSVEAGLAIMILISLVGAFLQIQLPESQSVETPIKKSREMPVDSARPQCCPLCQGEKKQTKAGFSRSGNQRYRCGHCKRLYTMITKSMPTSH